MKKILLLFLMLGLATGCDNQKEENLDGNGNLLEGNETIEENLESDYFQIVSFTKLKELLEDNTTKLIYFGSNGCGACLSFKPIAQQFAKENEIPIYFALLDDFSNDEYIELDSILSFDYIPYITVYKNNKFVYEESGVHSYDDLQNLVKQHNIGE